MSEYCPNNEGDAVQTMWFDGVAVIRSTSLSSNQYYNFNLSIDGTNSLNGSIYRWGRSYFLTTGQVQVGLSAVLGYSFNASILKGETVGGWWQSNVYHV